MTYSFLKHVNVHLQSSPKVIVQIAIAGAQILGKAFVAAGKQAVASTALVVGGWE